MQQKSKKSLLQGLMYLKQHPQIIFALMLLFVIPLLFLYTGQQFLEVGKYNQDRLQKDKVGIMHDVIVSLTAATNINVDLFEAEMDKLVAQNPDIVDYKLLQATPEGIVTLSSFKESEKGKKEENTEPYSSAALLPNESIIFEATEYNVRFWYSYRSFTDSVGGQYFLYTKSSLQAIDQLFATREFDAYIRLIFIYLFLLILAIWHIKLTDYRYLYNEARKAIETKDLFTHMIAHELRAPLTAIRGYASLLKDKIEDVTLHEQVSRIETSSERLITIVNDLLDIARIQSGKLEVKVENVNLNTVINQIVSEFRSTAESKGCVLLWKETATDLTISADKMRTEQIITNILSNAIKYTDKGTVTVLTEIHRSTVEVRIKDTGQGIGSDDQKKLFAPFFRTQSAETGGVTGTGLGMWITKQLIELMGGSIGVESIQGVGTQIVIIFPKAI